MKTDFRKATTYTGTPLLDEREIAPVREHPNTFRYRCKFAFPTPENGSYVEIGVDNYGDLEIRCSSGRLTIVPDCSNVIKINVEGS